MGAFHAGHHSLMQAARDEQDSVVVSLFVNPAQFNDTRDLAAYPRTEANDAAEAAELGVDVLFAPPRERDLPRRLRHHGPGRRALRGPRGRRARPRALRGRLHGRQQAAEHRRARTSPTSARRTRSRSRSSSGWCATSTCRCGSRSCRPSASPTASRCPRATSASPRPTAPARSASRAPCRPPTRPSPPASATPSAIRAAALAELGDVEPEYLALVDPLTFAPLHTVSARTLVAVAAQVGPVRLIDNIVLEPVPVATG